MNNKDRRPRTSSSAPTAPNDGDDMEESWPTFTTPRRQRNSQATVAAATTNNKLACVKEEDDEDDSGADDDPSSSSSSSSNNSSSWNTGPSQEEVHKDHPSAKSKTAHHPSPPSRSSSCSSFSSSTISRQVASEKSTENTVEGQDPNNSNQNDNKPIPSSKQDAHQQKTSSDGRGGSYNDKEEKWNNEHLASSSNSTDSTGEGHSSSSSATAATATASSSPEETTTTSITSWGDEEEEYWNRFFLGEEDSPSGCSSPAVSSPTLSSSPVSQRTTPWNDGTPKTSNTWSSVMAQRSSPTSFSSSPSSFMTNQDSMACAAGSGTSSISTNFHPQGHDAARQEQRHQEDPKVVCFPRNSMTTMMMVVSPCSLAYDGDQDDSDDSFQSAARWNSDDDDGSHSSSSTELHSSSSTELHSNNNHSDHQDLSLPSSSSHSDSNQKNSARASDYEGDVDADSFWSPSAASSGDENQNYDNLGFITTYREYLSSDDHSTRVSLFPTEFASFSTLNVVTSSPGTALQEMAMRSAVDNNSRTLSTTTMPQPAAAASARSPPTPTALLHSRPESILSTDPEWFQRMSIRLKSKSAWQTSRVMDETFEVIDKGEKGMLDRQDVAFLLAMACERMRLPVDEGIIHAAVISLFEEAGCLILSPKAPPGEAAAAAPVSQEHYRGDPIICRMMTKSQFLQLFENDKTRLRVFDSEEDMQERRHQVAAVQPQAEASDTHDATSQVWERAKTGWKNRRRSLIWLALYCSSVALVFCHKAFQLYRTMDGRAVGPFLVLAKGSGAVLNLQGALILLPILRHCNTWIRSTPLLRHLVIPADVANDAHALIGFSIVLFSLTHTLGHVVKILEVVEIETHDDLEKSVLGLIGTDMESLPESKAGRWGMMLRLRASWTGIVMWVILIAAYLAIPGRKVNFNRFWYLHQLLPLFLLFQCIHGTGNLLQRFQSVFWVALPMLLYLVPRIYREVCCRSVNVIGTNVESGGEGRSLVELTIAKPKGWESSLRVGQYALLNVPSISRFEWHPFTLSSSPADKFIQFQILTLGDWTNKLATLVEEQRLETNLPTTGESNDNYNTQAGQGLPMIRIEGPFGTPAETFRDHAVVVLIGGGIGITPMISVLRDLLHEPGRIRRLFFYWTFRERCCIEWYKSVFEDIYAHRCNTAAAGIDGGSDGDDNLILEIRNFVTSVKLDDRDLGSILHFQAAQTVHSNIGMDIFLGNQYMHEPVQMGRPDWEKELFRVATICQEEELSESSSCGVFLCGKQSMATQVRRACVKVTAQSKSHAKENGQKPVHLYFSKETF